MKHFILIICLALSLVGCSNKNITSRVISDVKEYTNCRNQEAFHHWLFDIGSEGTIIYDDGITYGVYRTFDPMTSEVGLMITIKDGVADYHYDDAISELNEKVKDALKNQRMVEAVYIEYGSVFVRLKNESNFNNVD